MDRLVIESILADVDEISLSDADSQAALVLGFKQGYADQVINVFTALKSLTHEKEVELIICKTLTSGIYDLELKTAALDEPVRILNKAISHELLAEIEEALKADRTILLASNVSPKDTWVAVTDAQVKECAVK